MPNIVTRFVGSMKYFVNNSVFSAVCASVDVLALYRLIIHSISWAAPTSVTRILNRGRTQQLQENNISKVIDNTVTNKHMVL